ncbi:sensor histidine kinase [Paenibacillus fonticola]|uniref:sensor histidine kinase n=1 Tax=Paenibacillus fonticola TaxID=379896 RepID=UPI000377DBA1|nr:HAMP domain-containing sensor histidine kinase [Paenibacillus fonticola]
MTLRSKIFGGMALLVLLVSAAYVGTTQGYLGSLFAQYFSDEAAIEIEPDQLQGIRDYIMSRMGMKAVTVTLFTAGIALLIGYWLSGTMTRPLKRLIAEMDKVADRQLDTVLPVQGSDEYGQVSKAFNKMTHQLRDSENSRKRLVEDVAHELRTPLSIVLTKLELVQQSAVDVKPETLLPLHDEVLRVIHLVDELQFLTSAEAGELHLQRKVTDLSGLLADLAELVRPEAEARSIRLNGPDRSNPMEADIDAKRVKQVILNLAANALRHTPSGGEISIRVSPAEDPAFIVVTVQDTGPGIPAETIAHLFDRFYKVDKSERSGGAGLGLAIVRQIVLAHGGRIEVRNHMKGGAEFTVYLPR